VAVAAPGLAKEQCFASKGISFGWFRASLSAQMPQIPDNRFNFVALKIIKPRHSLCGHAVMNNLEKIVVAALLCRRVCRNVRCVFPAPPVEAVTGGAPSLEFALPRSGCSVFTTPALLSRRRGAHEQYQGDADPAGGGRRALKKT